MLAEVAPQLAAHVHRPDSGFEVADVEHVVLDPDVVAPVLGDGILGHLAGVLDVADVENVESPERLDPVAVLDVEELREDLVPGDQVVAEPEHGMGPGQHVGWVEVDRRVSVPAHELGVIRAPALDPGPDVENDGAVFEVRQIGEAVLDLDIVEISAGGGPGLLIGEQVRVLDLPVTNLAGIAGVAEIDHPHHPGAVVGQVDVVSVDEGAVDPRGHRRGVLGEHLRSERIGQIEEDDPVLPVRGALAGDHPDLAIRGGRDVVDQPGVDHDRIDPLWRGRIGDVVGVDPPGTGAHVEGVIDRPTLGGLDVGIDHRSNRLEHPIMLPFGHCDRGAGGNGSGEGADDVAPRGVGDEPAIGVDGGATPAQTPGDR